MQALRDEGLQSAVRRELEHHVRAVLAPDVSRAAAKRTGWRMFDHQ